MRALGLLLLTAACGTESPTTVRLCNDTGFELNAVAWSSIYSLDSMRAGDCTDYETPMTKVYRYTDVQFRVQTDPFAIIPTDFVGETPLGEGAWSYHLTITDYAARSANVAAERD
jgi:hypothetical protein